MPLSNEQIITMLPYLLSFLNVLIPAIYIFRANQAKTATESKDKRIDSEIKAADSLREDLLQMIDAQGKRISAQEGRLEQQDAKVSTLQETIGTLWKQNEEMGRENYRLSRRIEELEIEDRKSKARIAELEAIIAQAGIRV